VTLPIIHFSHADGFPAPCYRRLFGFLESDFRIGYVDRIGHDPSFPVTDGWAHLVDELTAAIDARWNQPVVGVGHSLGGYLTAMAAVRRPELFRAVILLDAPILGSFTGSAVQFIKHIGLIDRVTPAGSVKHRRRHWPSREDAVAHFRRRTIFRNFDPECLEDYARFGTAEDANGVTLWFDPEHRVTDLPDHPARYRRFAQEARGSRRLHRRQRVHGAQARGAGSHAPSLPPCAGVWWPPVPVPVAAQRRAGNSAHGGGSRSAINCTVFEHGIHLHRERTWRRERAGASV
jgi:pimeloyl-ACP methyl ester carboxylesterase